MTAPDRQTPGFKSPAGTMDTHPITEAAARIDSARTLLTHAQDGRIDPLIAISGALGLIDAAADWIKQEAA